MYAHFWNHSC